MDMQLVQERIAGVAMEMFASACVISRLIPSCKASPRTAPGAGGRRAAELFLKQSFHRIRRFLSRADRQRRRGIVGHGELGPGKEKARRLQRPIARAPDANRRPWHGRR